MWTFVHRGEVSDIREPGVPPPPPPPARGQTHAEWARGDDLVRNGTRERGIITVTRSVRTSQRPGLSRRVLPCRR